MPAPGTKLIQIHGRDTYVPVEDAELEALVVEGTEITRQIAALKERLEPIKARITAIGERRREGRKSVFLTAPSGPVARVTFAGETRVDVEIVKVLEAELPETVFRSIFAKQTTYGLVKGYQGFMKQRQVPELEKLKARIATAIAHHPKKPAVKFLADLDEGGDGDEDGQ